MRRKLTSFNPESVLHGLIDVDCRLCVVRCLVCSVSDMLLLLLVLVAPCITLAKNHLCLKFIETNESNNDFDSLNAICVIC